MTFTTSLTTPLGALRIEGTKEYISLVSFSAESQASSQKLPPLAKEALAQLHAYFRGELKTFTFPIQQSGSDFQQKVWTELQKIPFGKTASYLHLAKAVADEKSTRAVGNANGKNAIAIVVPCHRIIGESGKLVGYAGGLWRKDWLLKHEAKIAHGVQSLF